MPKSTGIPATTPDTIAVPVATLQQLVEWATRLSMVAASELDHAGHAPLAGMPAPPLPANVVSLADRRDRKAATR
ncbi:hypothetical protein ACIBQX_18585 [Nonomuraea sp. NPDC049714]|uniref:hypothetical protein n=1 Tax=Nonomuraea sp. NPDC049714 TaxID=3364357 RepID=UPI00378F4228